MFCPSCGKPLVPGTRFCGGCGAGVAGLSPGSAAPPPLPPGGRGVPPPKPVSAAKGILIAVGIAIGLMVVVALVSAALFLGSGSSVKGIWAVNNSQVGTASSAASTPAGAAVPAIAPVSPEAPEPVPFDSVAALLKDEERVRGKVISVKGKVSPVGEDEIDFETGEEWSNWRVTCHFSTAPRTLQDSEEGQELTLAGTVPAEGATQLRAPAPEQTGHYELKLTGCRIP